MNNFIAKTYYDVILIIKIRVLIIIHLKLYTKNVLRVKITKNSNF